MVPLSHSLIEMPMRRPLLKRAKDGKGYDLAKGRVPGIFINFLIASKWNNMK